MVFPAPCRPVIITTVGGFEADRQLRLRSAHCLGELFVYYLYYLLTRHQALEHIRTDSALGHALDKVAHDLKVNIRLEQCELYLAHTLAHIRLGELTLAAKFFKCSVHLVYKTVEHKKSISPFVGVFRLSAALHFDRSTEITLRSALPAVRR